LRNTSSAKAEETRFKSPNSNYYYDFHATVGSIIFVQKTKQ